jgi:hypothetical protein
LKKDDKIKMALDLLPKSMFEAIDLLPDASTPVTLFTRHSLRELVDEIECHLYLVIFFQYFVTITCLA